MKEKLFMALAVFLAVAVVAAAVFGVGKLTMLKYYPGQQPAAHVHQWSEWGDAEPGSAKNDDLIQLRHCTNCGLAEFRVIEQTR